MNKRKKFIPHLLIALLSFFAALLYINTIEPSKIFDIKFFAVPSLIPFFFLFFLVIGGTMTFAFANVRRGVLAGIFFVAFLLLQYLHVNTIIYTVLLTVIILLIEFLFTKKK